jgi:hypothetical protein
MSGIMLDELVDLQIVDSGGDELDVNADGSINATVSATDLDIRDLTHVSDSVKIGDGTDFLAIAADGSISVTDNGGSLTVDAVDLDIRSLLNSSDSVAIGDETNLVDMQQMDSAFGTTSFGFPVYGIRQDAAGSPVSATGDAHPLVFNNDGELKVAADLTSSVADDDADSGNPVKIGGRGVDGLLSALSASNDRFDLLGDMYRRVWVNSSANVGMNVGTETVGLTAVELAATPLAGRRFVTIQNEGTADVYIGHANTVTTANGIKISKKSSATFELGEDIDIYAISGTAGQDVRVLQAG